MDRARRKAIKAIYERIRDGSKWQLPFPPKHDMGEGNGDDRHLASIIFYGAQGEALHLTDERHIWLAIQIGRELERAGIPSVVTEKADG